MEQTLISALFSFIVTFYAIPVIIKIAELKKLYDIPNERKVHLNPIPSLGGLGIFIGFILSLLLTIGFNNNFIEFQYYIAALLIIFFLGIKDDIIIISPWKKLIGQMIVAAILIFKGGLVISNMHGFFGMHEIQPGAGYMLTFFTILVIVNAFNLLDGVDGLAGSIGFITCLTFAVLFYIGGNIPYSLLGFAIAGSILAFLIYNFQPASIFMGDTGSMLIGTVNAILVLKFIQTGASFTNIYPNAVPAIGFGILIMPLLDTLRVFAIRIFSRRSPFSPDRNHLHHLLLDCGCSHVAVTLIISAASIFFIGFAFLMQNNGSTVVIISMITLFFTATSLLYFSKPRPVLRVVNLKNDEIQEKDMAGEIKLVSIFPATTALLEEETVN